MRLNFQVKLFLNLALLITLLFLILGSWYYISVTHRLYQRICYRAEQQAQQIASLESLQQAVERKDIPGIARIMSKISNLSDASFIVIGDAQAFHLYHSVTPSVVGTKMVGGDNANVLAGNKTTTQRRGSLGVSLRSKVPILNPQGKVIGIISVGYLQSYIDGISLSYILHITAAVLCIIVILFIFSWYFTHSIKQQIFSLEPSEIAMLVRQQKAVLESIYEGVISIDENGNVNTLNSATMNMLRFDLTSEQAFMGKPISSLISTTSFLDPQIMCHNDAHDEIAVFNQLTVIASRVRIFVEDKLQGWVITFRDQSEIDSFTAQLSQVKSHVNDLRVMRHEQLNRMSTISGLLSMGHYQEALNYVQAQSSHAQKVLDFLAHRFHSPLLCGLLLGKYSHGQEKGVELNFDPGSFLPEQSPVFSDSELISIIGNLLDNAIEATQKMPSPYSPIEVLIQQNERELLIEIADHGIGISPELKSSMFLPGITTKKDGDHGLGLHLIASYVNRANGIIEVSDNNPNGTIFSLFIPIPYSPLIKTKELSYAT